MGRLLARELFETKRQLEYLSPKAHSIGFRGGVCPRSSKASRRKDLQIE